MAKTNFPMHEDFLEKYDHMDNLNMLDDPLQQYNELKIFIEVRIHDLTSDGQHVGAHRERH